MPSAKPTSTAIAERLATLPTLPNSALYALWNELFPEVQRPTLRRSLLIPVLAYRLQEQAFGGLSPATRTRLRQLAAAFKKNPEARDVSVPIMKPGTRLLRQWREQVHTVTVQPNGYEYGGHRYRSLSQITRLITGTRWSGPLFFGLKNRQPQTEPKDTL